MRTQEQVNEIVRLLMAEYPLADCTLDWNKAYELLFSVRLAAQCTDERVNKITPALFARFPTLEAFAEADVAEVEEYVHSCGFYRAKARDIVGAAQMILRDFGGRVPDNMDDLLKLPGVGRKTANVVAIIAFHQSAMPVDTHVFRVSDRLGLTTGAKTPLQTEMQLTARIPAEDLPAAHHWLILHGRYVCTARVPKCAECGISTWCRKYAEDNKRSKTE